MRKVVRGYAKEKDGNLILIGTMPVPYSKDKSSPRERKDKRRLVGPGRPFQYSATKHWRSCNIV